MVACDDLAAIQAQDAQGSFIQCLNTHANLESLSTLMQSDA